MPEPVALEASSAGHGLKGHWADPICHPLPLGAALLLALNDHWLKGSGLLPELVTGKLSDLCGLFFFPALLWAIARGLGALLGRRPPALLLPLLLSLVAVGFAAVNLSSGFNAWYQGIWGVKQLDPTDLFALPVLVPSWLWLRRYEQAP